ncbi:hypothetical protein Tco_0051138 [Tanacetum coccineum]
MNVDNVDRLIGNLCTLCIGRMHLHANVVRFERPPVRSSRSSQPLRPDQPAPSFVSVVKGISVTPLSASPAMVLDDSCMVSRDLGNYAMGEVGVASWFTCFGNAQTDLVPVIGSFVLDLEECSDDFFGRKRICIKTKQEDNILEKCKIIVKGKIFVVRAKELFVWSLTFKDVPEIVLCSDDESVKEEGMNRTEFCKQPNMEDESDNKVISETCFSENADEDGNVADSVQSPIVKENSTDPFNIYDLLNKRNKEADTTGTDSSIPFPPGFTPEKNMPQEDE